jgi:DNA-binding beta-propeller fold protein YncE
MKRFLCLGAVLFLAVLWAGCGEVFRPIIIPNPPQFPNPAAAHTVVTISNNGITTTGAGVPAENPLPGSAMVIDVSGDSVVSIKNMGLNPVHAVMQTGNSALVVNQAVTGLPTPASGCVVTINSQDFNVCPTLTRLQFNGITINNTSTLTLPTNSAANFVATTESSQAYVSLPNLFLDPIGHPNDATVAVINTTNNNITTEVMVGNNPVAMAETPDGTKLYVANHGDGTLNAFNTKPSIATRTICDPTGKTCPPPLSSAPVWISARSDSQQVYVLESNGTLAYLNTSLTAGDTFTETSITAQLPVPATSANMWYDTILNRLYIPGGSGLTIVDVSQSVPQDQTFPGAIFPQFTVVSPSERFTWDPCSRTTAPSTVSVVAATSLPDGSRAYIGSYYLDGSGNVCPQVTVIDTTNNTIKTSVAVPGFPDATNSNSQYYAPACAGVRFRFTMAAAGDSSRAYLASCDGGNVNIIYTSTDAYAENASAPASNRNPIPPSIQNPPQNPAFSFAGP